MIKRVKPMYVIPQLLLSQKEKYSFSLSKNPAYASSISRVSGV